MEINEPTFFNSFVIKNIKKDNTNTNNVYFVFWVLRVV